MSNQPLSRLTRCSIRSRTPGGGPFGLGRLPAAELPAFEKSVVDLVDALREDSLQQDDPVAASLAAYAARQPGENMALNPEEKLTEIREEDEDEALMGVKSDQSVSSTRPGGSGKSSFMEQLTAARASRGSRHSGPTWSD